jgi:hypothetical protein
MRVYLLYKMLLYLDWPHVYIGPQPSLEAARKRKKLYSRRESNPVSSVVQPITSSAYYPDCTLQM